MTEPAEEAPKMTDGEKPADVQSELKLDPAEELALIAADRDKYLELARRTRADFENYQTRVRREMDTERKFAGIPLISDLLPVLDNLDRALESSKSSTDAATIVKGLEIVRRQFLDAFGKNSI